MLDPQYYLKLEGHGISGSEKTIKIMCGDDPPTITNGYATWQEIPRPLLRGVSIFQGYSPMEMTVSLRFGRWSKHGWDLFAGDEIEDQIDKLGLMAGEKFWAGRNPIVYVTAYGLEHDQVNLIPPQYQVNYPWVINGGIQWGKQIRAHDSGSRIWAECTFTLMEYLAYTKAPSQTSGTHGAYVSSKVGADTAQKIAAAVLKSGNSAKVDELARDIVQASKNNKLDLRSIKTKIPHGKSVWVPGS